MGPIGVPEMMVIVLIALILFGPKKLPELGRTLGKAMTEFRRATSDLKSSFEREMRNLEHEVDAEKTPPAAASTNVAAGEPHSGYEDPYEDSYEAEDAAPAAQASEPEAPAQEKKAETAPAANPGVEGTVARSEATPQHS